MPGDAHIFFIVAMPACGLFIMDDAMAAPAIVALAVGFMAADDMVLVDAMTICATAEVEVVLVVMPFTPGMLAISIFALFPLQSLDRHGGSEYQ